MTGQTFEQWLATVDKTLDRLAGLSHDDLTDIAWHKLWEGGMAAAQAARKILVETFGSL